MTSAVKRIQISLVVLLLISTLLILWNYEYVTVIRPATYSHLHPTNQNTLYIPSHQSNRVIHPTNTRTTTSTVLDSPLETNLTYIGKKMLHIPPIRIHDTSKNIEEATNVDNITLVNGLSNNTKRTTIKLFDASPLLGNATTVKLDNIPSRLNYASAKLDKLYSRDSDTSTKLEKTTMSFIDTSVKLDNPQFSVNESSVKLDNSTLDVNESSVKVDYPQLGVNDSSVNLDNRQLGVNDSLVNVDNPQFGVNDSLVKLDNPQFGVNDSSVNLDIPQLPNNDSSVDSQKEQWAKFPYPLDVDMIELVRKVKLNIPVDQKPIFPYKHNFTYHRKETCRNGSPSFIFLIKSAINNTKIRTAIRDTWAHSKLQKKYNFVRIFFVGNSDNRSDVTAIKKEIKKYKDIVWMSFHDNYYNNTLKTIGAIHWTTEHCNRSKFVVFVDDDMLVSIKTLHSFIKHKVTSPTFFGGHVDVHHPERLKESKWYVSVEDYPHALYPPMPSGGFMIMTMNFVIDLHFASQYTKKFIYDDCYLAILAYKLHVEPVNIQAVHVEPIHTNNQLLRHSIAAHGYGPEVLRSTWRLLKHSFVSHGEIT